MISFLNPWLWAGLLAVAAPLYLHLRRETDILRRIFPAVRFLEDQPLHQHYPRKLTDPWLLLLRCLALLFLSAAFAWPYLRDASQIVIRESRVYILDNTLSHQAGQGFARDRDRLAAEIERQPGDVQAAAVELTAQPRVLFTFGDDRALARHRVQRLAPSSQRGSYLAAFRQANALLANSLGEKKRIIYLGDNQENQWNENLNTPPFLYQVMVEQAKPALLEKPNLALSEPRIQRLFLGEKSLVMFTVKLTHRGPAKTAQAALRANGQLLFDRAVELVDQPETISLQAQWEADAGVWLTGEVSLEGEPDALKEDNRVYFSLPPVREGRVALLAYSPYLRLALSPEVMRGQWAVQMLDPARLPSDGDAGQDAEVLCLESSFLQASDARKLVWRYLTNGRGVLLFVNRVSPVITGVLRELGFDVEKAAPTPDRPEKFQYVYYNHPVFYPFQSPDYGNLLEITVTHPARLKALQGLPLIFSESGDALFFQGTRFPGRLFVAAFGMDRAQTSWPVHLTCIPFLDLCLQNARMQDTTPLSYEPAEACVLPAPNQSAAREVVLRDGRREILRAAFNQGKASFAMPGQPGLYSLSFDNQTEPDKIFSVNPSPKESILRYVETPEALKLWVVDRPREAPQPVMAASAGYLSRSAILQQTWWWWLLMAGWTVLVVEMLVTLVARARGSVQ